MTKIIISFLHKKKRSGQLTKCRTPIYRTYAIYAHKIKQILRHAIRNYVPLLQEIYLCFYFYSSASRVRCNFKPRRCLCQTPAAQRAAVMLKLYTHLGLVLVVQWNGLRSVATKLRTAAPMWHFLATCHCWIYHCSMVSFGWNTISHPCATTSRAGVTLKGKGAWDSTTHHSHSRSCATGSLLSASTHWHTWLALLWVITSNFHLKMVRLWGSHTNRPCARLRSPATCLATTQVSMIGITLPT